MMVRNRRKADGEEGTEKNTSDRDPHSEKESANGYTRTLADERKKYSFVLQPRRCTGCYRTGQTFHTNN